MSLDQDFAPAQPHQRLAVGEENRVSIMLGLLERGCARLMRQGGGGLIKSNDSCRPHNLRKRGPITKDEIVRMKELAAAGHTPEQIATATSRTLLVVQRVTAKPIRPERRGRPFAFDRDVARRLRAAGKTFEQIAAELGCHHSAVSRVLGRLTTRRRAAA